MITITLNGKNTQIARNSSVDQLLASMDLSGKRIAIEINQEIIPRGDFSSHFLAEQDKVEIVQAIGGGSSF